MICSKLIKLLCCCSLMMCTDCKPNRNTTEDAIKDNAELIEMVKKDQQVRQSNSSDYEPVDKNHREKVMSMLANGKIITGLDKFNAALILQHTALIFCNDELQSLSAENYLLAYYLAKSAYESGYKDAKYFTAVTYDRYLLYTKGCQKYGTQRIIDSKTNQEVWAPIDPVTTDAEREKYGVPKLDSLKKQYPVGAFSAKQ